MCRHRYCRHYGFRFGWCFPSWPFWAAPLSREEEARMLRLQKEWLKERLEAINRRLAEVERASPEKEE